MSADLSLAPVPIPSPSHVRAKGLHTYIRCWRIPLQIRLNGLVLLVQVRQVGHEVLDHVRVRQRVDFDLLRIAGNPAYESMPVRKPIVMGVGPCPEEPFGRRPIPDNHGGGRGKRGGKEERGGRIRTQTGQGVDAVDVHGTAAADTLTAAAPEGQGRVLLVLDADQRVQHHGAGLVEIERKGLHVRLLGRLVGAPAIDLKGLGQWRRLRVADGRHGPHRLCGRRDSSGHGRPDSSHPWPCRGGRGAQEAHGGGAQSSHCEGVKTKGAERGGKGGREEALFSTDGSKASVKRSGQS